MVLFTFGTESDNACNKNANRCNNSIDGREKANERQQFNFVFLTFPVPQRWGIDLYFSSGANGHIRPFFWPFIWIPKNDSDMDGRPSLSGARWNPMSQNASKMIWIWQFAIASSGGETLKKSSE